MSRLPHRRGVAFLLVLGALVISVTAALIASESITRGRLNRSASDDDAAAGDLLRSCETPIRFWLVNDSPTVALPADAQTSSIVVLHDTWEDAAGPRVEVRITAWDQCGMVPVQAVRFGDPLAGTVSEHAREAALALAIEWLDHPGLDQLVTAEPVYPESAVTIPEVFGSHRPRIRDTDMRTGGPSIGAELSTHTPGAIRSRRGDVPVLLNVNTAPRPLLEVAMRLAGRGGIETILDKRDEGEPATMGDMTTASAGNDTAVRFIAGSPAWAFRIDVRVGMIQRSTWEVWTRTSSDWEVVQRLAISE